MIPNKNKTFRSLLGEPDTDKPTMQEEMYDVLLWELRPLTVLLCYSIVLLKGWTYKNQRYLAVNDGSLLTLLISKDLNHTVEK